MKTAMTDTRPGAVRDHFDTDWLTLREPVDHAARAMTLSQQLAAWLEQTDRSGPLQLVDLGCGRGSNLRYLAPLLPGPQSWSLVDHDERLLSDAARLSIGSRDRDHGPVHFNTIKADLRDPGAWQHLLNTDTDVVTASALIDLVAAPWLDQLVHGLQHSQAALLVALSYNGEFTFSQPHPLDAEVRQAFNAHQQASGPFGTGLGPTATEALRTRLQAAGYRVSTAASPWTVPPRHAALQRGLVLGWQDAASEQRPQRAKAFAAWAQQHLQQAGSPECTLQVGHTDLLALPPEPQ